MRRSKNVWSFWKRKLVRANSLSENSDLFLWSAAASLSSAASRRSYNIRALDPWNRSYKDVARKFHGSSLPPHSIKLIRVPPSGIGCYDFQTRSKLSKHHDLISRAWKAAAPRRKLVKPNAVRIQSDSIIRGQGIGSAKTKSQARKWWVKNQSL